nr:uncharacterized protein LOC129014584 [Pongo pygmaeus]
MIQQSDLTPLMLSHPSNQSAILLTLLSKSTLITPPPTHPHPLPDCHHLSWTVTVAFYRSCLPHCLLSRILFSIDKLDYFDHENLTVLLPAYDNLLSLVESNLKSSPCLHQPSSIPVSRACQATTEEGAVDLHNQYAAQAPRPPLHRLLLPVQGNATEINKNNHKAEKENHTFWQMEPLWKTVCAPHLWRPCSAQSRCLLAPSPPRSPPLPVGSASPPASAPLASPLCIPGLGNSPPPPGPGRGCPSLPRPSVAALGPSAAPSPPSLLTPWLAAGSPAHRPRPRPRHPAAPARVAQPPVPPGRLCSAVLPGVALSPGPCAGHPGTFRPESGSCCRGSWDRGMGAPAQRPTGSWPPRARATRTNRSTRSEGPVTATEPARGQSPRQTANREAAGTQGGRGGRIAGAQEFETRLGNILPPACQMLLMDSSSCRSDVARPPQHSTQGSQEE